MEIPTNVSIGRITQSVVFDDYGHAMRVKMIDYKVGLDGPFTLEVRPENDSQEWIATRLTEAAAKIAQLRGGA